MAAGNEVGVLQPLEEIGRVCRDHGIVFHTDATQIVGKLDLNVTEAGIDLLSLSAHKFYGPKGVGALFIRDGLQTRPRAFMDGGGQERGLRPGTLNVPGIVGLGMACEIATAEWRTESGRVAGLRDRLQGLLFDTIPDTHLNGPSEKRLPGNLNVSFGGIDGEGLLMAVDDVALSSGSACTSAALEPSYVLKALGLSVRRIQGSIRFGLGRFNTGQEVDYVADRVTKEVGRLRDLSPTYRREKSDGATPEQRSTDARES